VIYRILFVLSGGVIIISWLLLPSAGEREFKQSQEALRHVTSWRQEARIGSQGNEHVEIVCPDRVSTAAVQCAKLMQGEYPYPLPNYNRLIMHTKIVKGAIDTVQGSKCQEWTTTRVIPGRYAPAQPLDNEQICIGLDDHLPRRIRYEQAEYIFYDWNTPIQIEGLQTPQASHP
jgi:hypothetical protein